MISSLSSPLDPFDGWGLDPWRQDLLEIPPFLDRRRRRDDGSDAADIPTAGQTENGGSEDVMARKSKQNEEDMPLEKRLKGYLVTTVIGWIKEQNKVYRDLDEENQRLLITNLDQAFGDLIQEAVTTIAARGFTSVHGTLESLAIKDGVKASVKLLRDVETIAELGPKTGSTVMIVLAEPREFFGGTNPKPDPMQKPLIEPAAPSD